METLADDVRAYVEGRLDLGYVDRVAGFVAAGLLAGVACEANFQPGDGTRYGLVFVPLSGLATAPASPMEEEWNARHPRIYQRRAVDGLAYEPGAALVVWAEHGFLACQFRDRACIHWTDARRAFETTEGSAHALAFLFGRIADLVDGLLRAENGAS